MADGCAMKTEYYHKHHGVDPQKLTIDELEQHEEKMKEKNAWCIAQEVADRINGEPGPEKSFMSSFVTDRNGKCDFKYRTNLILYCL